jgi:hypothetical protein
VQFKFNYLMGLHHFCLCRVAHDEEKYGIEVAHGQVRARVVSCFCSFVPFSSFSLCSGSVAGPGLTVLVAQLSEAHLARCRSFGVGPEIQQLAGNLTPVRSARLSLSSLS